MPAKTVVEARIPPLAGFIGAEVGTRLGSGEPNIRARLIQASGSRVRERAILQRVNQVGRVGVEVRLSDRTATNLGNDQS